MKMKGMRHMQISHETPSPWEIWWAYVEYEDQLGEGKIRPVLVLPGIENSVMVMALKMTIHPVRYGYKGEYEIIDYQGTGLKKKTTVRCSKVLFIDLKMFKNRIGILQPRDMMNIINILGNI